MQTETEKRTMENCSQGHINPIYHLYVDEKRYNLNIRDDGERTDCTYDRNLCRCVRGEGCNYRSSSSAC